MPRKQMRADGVPGTRPTNPHPQPNGRPLTAQDVPTGLPYGEGGALRQAIAQTPPAAGVGAPGTPPPPGIDPEAHAARQALAGYNPQVTPLFAPTERPNESVLAGATGPGAIGPAHPMALPEVQGSSVGSILSQVASSTNSPALQQLAQRAAALGQ